MLLLIKQCILIIFYFPIENVMLKNRIIFNTLIRFFTLEIKNHDSEIPISMSKIAIVFSIYCIFIRLN